MFRVGNEKTGSSNLFIPVVAGAEMQETIMVAINKDGYAEPAQAKENQKIAGVCVRYVDNTKGSNGDMKVHVKRGTFVFKNSTTNPAKITDILKSCYIEDETTITMSSDNSVIAGTIINVESDGVTIEIN